MWRETTGFFGTGLMVEALREMGPQIHLIDLWSLMNPSNKGKYQPGRGFYHWWGGNLSSYGLFRETSRRSGLSYSSATSILERDFIPLWSLSRWEGGAWWELFNNLLKLNTGIVYTKSKITHLKYIWNWPTFTGEYKVSATSSFDFSAELKEGKVAVQTPPSANKRWCLLTVNSIYEFLYMMRVDAQVFSDDLSRLAAL